MGVTVTAIDVSNAMEYFGNGPSKIANMTAFNRNLAALPIAADAALLFTQSPMGYGAVANDPEFGGDLQWTYFAAPFEELKAVVESALRTVTVCFTLELPQDDLQKTRVALEMRYGWKRAYPYLFQDSKTRL